MSLNLVYPKPNVYTGSELGTCIKCGNHATKATEPTKKYDPGLNVIIRTCICCGFKWLELCADGSEPNPEINELTIFINHTIEEGEN